MTPLVLIPGMMCDARLFGPQISLFSGTRDVILPSLATENTVEAMAGRILDSLPDRIALCGLSMGGIVAMEMLRQAPERIERIALLDTNHLAETDEVRARRGPQMEAVRQGRLAQVMREEMKPNYLAPGPHQAAILDLCMAMAENLGPEAFLRQSEALMTRPDQTKTLQRAQLPALVLCGLSDSLCPVQRHQDMADLIPDARLVVVPYAGHLPVLEQPDRVNTALAQWLERKMPEQLSLPV